MMHTAPLDSFGDLTSEGRFVGRETFSAVGHDHGRCRLTVFTPELSADEQFRAAWRRDLGLLRLLPHDGLPLIIDSRDEQGIVYLATEPVPEMTLGEYLESNTLAWDEIADIGWQIASVMQHLHNSGLAHGGLDDSCVRMTPQLRVCVVDTGVVRWILAAGDGAACADINHQCRNDLVSLGSLMRRLALPASGNEVLSSDIPGEWWELIEDLSDATSKHFPSTAREVQGRLGRILLEESGDAMRVVAARTGLGHRRSSILDELLPADSPLQHGEVPKTSERTVFMWICLIAAFAAIALTIVLLRGTYSVLR
jgi:serine/threonine protein kinase